MFVYIQSEPQLWTVGIYASDGKFIPERDHGLSKEAADRVCYLNGGKLRSAGTPGADVIWLAMYSSHRGIITVSRAAEISGMNLVDFRELANKEEYAYIFDSNLDEPENAVTPEQVAEVVLADKDVIYSIHALHNRRHESDQVEFWMKKAREQILDALRKVMEAK